MRLAHLGVGLSLPMGRVNAQTLSAVLGRLLVQPSFRDRSQAVALQMDVAGFHEQACLAVEALSA
jgi:UDP:flavonoid glycosyltransferase YjiC (YdhE family)